MMLAMRLIVYDRNPGQGISQKLLSFFWAAGCFLQKLFGRVDAYYGASSWDDALTWIEQYPGTILSFQYWGHGSPGTAWLAGTLIPLDRFISVMKPKVVENSIIWWRTCSSFQGVLGVIFARKLACDLNCKVAGHTRIIGLVQGGLHSCSPNALVSWSVNEVEPAKSWLPGYLRWGPNSITCFATKVPKGW